MKKFLALIMALAMVFTLVACGNNEDTESTPSTDDVIELSSDTDTTDTSSEEDEESSEPTSTEEDEESSKITSSKDKASSKITSSKDKVSSKITSSKDKVSSKITSSKDKESSKITSSKDKASSKITSSKDKVSSKKTSSKDKVSSEKTSSKDKVSSKNTSSKDKVSSESVSSEEPEVCKHENVEIISAKEATCEVEGNTEGKTCKDCGVVLVKSEVVPKADHNFRPATITKPKTCKVCGATEGSPAVPEAPEAVIDNSFPIMQNGAEITFSVKKIEYTDNTYTKCIITYHVSIKNGSFAAAHAWNLNVGYGDVGGTVGGGKISDQTPTLQPNEQYEADFQTTPIDPVGHVGYRLTFS